MRKKGNHNGAENAVEAYLRENNVPFIGTNEGKRVSYNGGTIKNFDLILPGRLGCIYVDVKGRKFSYESVPGDRWENWILKDDVESLKIWSTLGNQQQAYLLYAYSLPDSGEDLPNCFKGNSFFFNEKIYAFFTISIQDYINNSKHREEVLSNSIGRQV